MKVVLYHDWLTGFRGGERVLEALCELFPDAPLYTLIHQKGSTSKIIESREIVTSFLDNIPGIYQNYRKFLPLMPLAADLMKVHHDADLIISSSHCVIKGIKKPKGAKHICYIHSPMRYIYDQFDNYFGNSNIVIKTIAHLIRPYLTWWDKRSNKNVDLFIPNSKFVENRIHTYYGKNIQTKIIHPFVDIDNFKTILANPPAKEDFYLMVTAFAPNKRVDLAIKAFNTLGLPLKIIGGGSIDEVESLSKVANSNIEFLGKVSREEVINCYAKAKAFIFPGVEDFGITPLEAMISSTPTIAFKKGGVLETLTDKTASFFTEPTSEALIDAVKNFDSNQFKSHDLISRAQCFSKDIFKSQIQEQITKVMSL